METHETVYGRMPDMPHEVLMDRLGLDFDDMNAPTQREIRLFEKTLQEAWHDGVLYDNEQQQLITLSYNISKMIEQEHGTDSNGSMTVGIFSGILLAIGAAIGIKQLTKL